MKRRFVPFLVVGIVSALSLASMAFAADAPAKKAKKPSASRYLVIAPHTQEQCLKALDEISAQGSGALGKFDFGCEAGDHTGYAWVNATSDEDALKLVPADMRGNARAIKMTKFTPQALKQIHAKYDTPKGNETGNGDKASAAPATPSDAPASTAAQGAPAQGNPASQETPAPSTPSTEQK